MSSIALETISTRAPKELVKVETKEQTATILKHLNELQNVLYAESKHSILVILQGLDASGKDGAIRNVFSAFNPQGIAVKSFKVPTEEELAHDFLWRIHNAAPAKGMIHVYNRSHYEDILVTRVHKRCDDETAMKRMRAINDFEWLLTEHNNTHILKFYLHISQEEQQLRLQERLTDPEKQWKYNERDFEEAKYWNEYQRKYEDCFEHCSAVPWTIVPADQNWYKEHMIATTLYNLMKELDLKYPVKK